jgi:hypothetical protein
VESLKNVAKTKFSKFINSLTKLLKKLKSFWEEICTSMKRPEEVEDAEKIAKELNFEEAFQEGASYYTGELKSKGRMHRPKSQELVPSFDELHLTKAQREAVKRISGQKLDSDFQSAWKKIIDSNKQAKEEIIEVQKLFESGQVKEACKLARSAYKNAMRRFWTKVRSDSTLKETLEKAGLKFGESKTTSPYWEFPDGYKEKLTLEHSFRVTDKPWKALDEDNFQFVPFRENSNTLEWIRAQDEF